MYYILFETGNERFFRYITKLFASKVAKNMEDASASVYNLIKGKRSDNPIRDALEDYFTGNGKNLFFFDCGLFVHTGRCRHGCSTANRKAVLTKYQWRVLDKAMIETKKHSLRTTTLPPLKRAVLQTMFQYYEAANGEHCETLDTRSISPRHNPSLYLLFYLIELRKLRGNSIGFTYIRNTGTNIRNGTKSDFNVIKKRWWGFANLVACDEF